MSKDELHLFRRQQIEDYRKSGQSAETWCDGNAMKVSTLRYWLRRIKDADQPEPEQAWATMKLIDKATPHHQEYLAVKSATSFVRLFPKSL